MASEPTLIWRLEQRLGRGTLWLMATLLGVHVLFLLGRSMGGPDGAAMTLYNDHLALSAGALRRGELQTLATYGLLHDLDGYLHILFNVMVLYFFGPALERRWGTAAFLRYFAIAAVAGGVFQGGFDLMVGRENLTVGASAGLMALLAAFAWSNPNAQILLFFVIPVQARYLIPVTVGMDLLVWLTDGGVAFFAHLGGLAAAWVLLRGIPPRRHMAATARGTWVWLLKRLGLRKQRPFHVIDGGRKNDRDRSRWN
ncbi:MAG: rhomboid family intramembrane serine protease [Myxococcota bacterium]